MVTSPHLRPSSFRCMPALQVTIASCSVVSFRLADRLVLTPALDASSKPLLPPRSDRRGHMLLRSTLVFPPNNPGKRCPKRRCTVDRYSTYGVLSRKANGKILIGDRLLYGRIVSQSMVTNLRSGLSVSALSGYHTWKLFRTCGDSTSRTTKDKS